MLYITTKPKSISQATRIDFDFGIIYQGESMAAYKSSSSSSTSTGVHVCSSNSITSFYSISIYNKSIARFK
jgi:hypothetical protein